MGVHRTNVNGTNLAYELTGQGATVVLLHGFALDLRMWDDQIPALSQRFQVLRYDRRGFGRSDPVERGVPFSPSEDLRALLLHLGISKVHLIGLSAGGGLALNFALEMSEFVDRMVLVDSSLEGFAWSPGYIETWNRVEWVAKKEGVEAARKCWLAHPFFAPALEHPEVGRRIQEMAQEYSGWHWLHDNPGKGLDPPAIQRLATVRHPTLVLVGERDVPDFRNIARVLAGSIPGAREEVVLGAGHMLNMEAPAEFNQRVLDFLSPVSVSPSMASL